MIAEDSNPEQLTTDLQILNNLQQIVPLDTMVFISVGKHACDHATFLQSESYWRESLVALLSSEHA